MVSEVGRTIRGEIKHTEDQGGVGDRKSGGIRFTCEPLNAREKFV